MKTTSNQITRTNLLFLILFALPTVVLSQQTLPSIKVLNGKGRMIDISTIKSQGRPVLMIFWKLSDLTSCKNLEAIFQTVNDSLEKENVKIVAICTDEAHNNVHVKPWLMAKEMEIEVYFDTNGDLRRAMGVNPPFTFLFDKDMKVFCKQSGYCAGNESILCSKIRDCIDKIGE
jgi:peroxiredoxin